MGRRQRGICNSKNSVKGAEVPEKGLTGKKETVSWEGCSVTVVWLMCQIQAGFIWSMSDRPMLRRACLLRCFHCPLLQPFYLAGGGSQGSGPTLLWTKGFRSALWPRCPGRLRRQQVAAVMCWLWHKPPSPVSPEPLRAHVGPALLKDPGVPYPSYPLWLQHL